MLHRSYDENNGLNTSHRKIFWPKALPPPTNLENREEKAISSVSHSKKRKK